MLGSTLLREMTGQVRPREVCQDGMVKDEVCVFPWEAVVTEGGSPVSGLGTMSAFDMLWHLRTDELYSFTMDSSIACTFDLESFQLSDCS